MSEKTMRHEFLKLTAPLHPVAVENMISVSFPDVCFVPGVAELKWLREWPKRAATPVRFDHYTQGQKDFLLTRWRAGGGAWLALQCKREWFVWDGERAQAVGTLTRKELQETANHYSPVKPTPEEICSWFVR